MHALSKNVFCGGVLFYIELEGSFVNNLNQCKNTAICYTMHINYCLFWNPMKLSEEWKHNPVFFSPVYKERDSWGECVCLEEEDLGSVVIQLCSNCYCRRSICHRISLNNTPPPPTHPTPTNPHHKLTTNPHPQHKNWWNLSDRYVSLNMWQVNIREGGCLIGRTVSLTAIWN